ncbi:MAG: TPM domain-containing protein [Spirochaetia bacterium]|jgi:uncharacterized protein|nr:TPM domain-containing protein [Spirochaetia bacterium]
MKHIKYILFITFLFITAANLVSLEVPALKGYVNDYANILSSSEEQQIAQILANMEKTTTAQGALLIIPTLDGDSLESFSIRVAENWQLGQSEKDNGFLILLAMNEKKVRIEVGYGLEGLLTDVKSGYIIREIIIPEFKKGNFANGLYQGTIAASSVISSTSDISEEIISSGDGRTTSSRSGIPFNFIFFIIIFFISSLARRGRRRGGFLQALFLGSMLSSSSRRHSGLGGSSFGGGSFGGGGFSGGGGGFGGGGASGGW